MIDIISGISIFFISPIATRKVCITIYKVEKIAEISNILKINMDSANLDPNNKSIISLLIAVLTIKSKPKTINEYFKVSSKYLLVFTTSFFAKDSLINGNIVFLIDVVKKPIIDVIVNAGTYNPTISFDSKYPRNNLSIEVNNAKLVLIIIIQKPVFAIDFNSLFSFIIK